MKKIHIILSLLVLSVIWAQKEVPGSGSISETTSDERLNGKRIQPIDANVVQQVRMLKANKEKSGSWRPSAICLSERSFERLAAFDLLRWISQRYGFGTYIHLIKGYHPFGISIGGG